MKENNQTSTIQIYSGTLWEAQIVKNLLEEAEIEVFLKEEILGSLNLPWASNGGGIGMSKVIILESDYENAKLIVDDFRNNLLKDN